MSKIAHGALTPIVSASRRPQLVYLGTAPNEDNEDAQVLSGVRARALERAPQVAYWEWSADAESPAALSDEMARDPAVWAQANPAYPGRIGHEQIQAEYDAMDPTTFAAERLSVGFWPNPLGLPGVLDLEAWAACEDSATPLTDELYLGFDVARDRAHTTIVAASICADELPHLELVERCEGTEGLGERLVGLCDRHKVRAVLTDPKGPVGPLMAELERAGVNAHASAAGMLFDRVVQRRMRYRFHKALDAAVKAAETRPLGDAGWTWSRKSSACDVSPLTASTYALYGALTNAGNRRPELWIYDPFEQTYVNAKDFDTSDVREGRMGTRRWSC